MLAKRVLSDKKILVQPGFSLRKTGINLKNMLLKFKRKDKLPSGRGHLAHGICPALIYMCVCVYVCVCVCIPMNQGNIQAYLYSGLMHSAAFVKCK
jgi:hypothetical protein